MRSVPQPSQSRLLVCVRRRQRKYELPTLFNLPVKAAPHLPHLIIPANHVIVALWLAVGNAGLFISFLRQASHVSEDTSPSCGATTSAW